MTAVLTFKQLIRMITLNNRTFMIQCNTIHSNTNKFNINRIQHNAIKYNTTQYNTTQHNTTHLSFMMSASTLPPENTMCFLRGGSSTFILIFRIRSVLPDIQCKRDARKSDRDRLIGIDRWTCTCR